MLWTLLFFCLIGTSAQNQGANCTTGKLIEGGKTNQSSTYTDHFSDRAVDGNYSACAHTENKSNSWWTIDLLGLYEISCINIDNIHHHSVNITNAQILIGNSSDGNFNHHNVCTTISDSTNGQNLTFKCDNGPMSGRYVTVHLERTFFVVVCEVKIYGFKKDGLMLVQENRTWEEALYHCRDLNMDLVSILDEDTQGWVELEARKADSPYVWLGLHYTCTLDFWFWVDDHVVTFNHWGPGEKGKENCDMSAVMDTKEKHYWFTKSDYDEYNFICAK
ncbi:fucolectin-3-like [Mugil cephalus]|uniref:fucolectin-3-like n=1 Tax=Mugil cephalus TaxID=48193 RepID=UPI001FB5A326|nr:fucolectin-3-like [Mugil cephalus]XP_047454736.1 fucolectin-3-like [Mugil cephalus]XP_047454737.1 fucolectin-3-like [Mugil cephalus]XP_047454739.1 fucolectin-3-like [Mugil cephalus]XP_047454740.1 fucolectin-3-like [Mugil cephalus]XP_047454741.1 fucolectin-3-like [Mugil cephalus]